MIVMLSAESAAGKYPVESVTMQQLIINKVEVSEQHTILSFISFLDRSFSSSSDCSCHGRFIT